MKINFKKEWFNPLYFILNDLLQYPDIDTILIFGGKSSSKTVSVAQLLSKELCCHGVNSIAFRKESSTIDTTLKKSFNLAREKMYLYQVMGQFDKFYRYEGAEIQLKGIDDESKAKGIESYKFVYLDELDHFKFKEYNQFQMSLRGIPGQKIFASWNPIDENSWIKTKLIDTKIWKETNYKLPSESSYVKISGDGSTILIKTTYLDNYWINGSPCGTYGYADKNLIKRYNELKLIDENQYNINVLGEWGTNKEGKIFNRWELYDEDLKSFDIRVYGLDFGFSVSKTACIEVTMNGNNIYLKEILYVNEYENPDIYHALKHLDNNCYIVCDSAEPKSISELNTYGLSAISCGNKTDMFNFFVQKMNSSKVFLHKDSENLIYEWQNIKYLTNKEGIRLGGQVKKDDHLFDAAKMAICIYAR
jgi:PBSX family phage terminase large subunit